MDKKFILSKGDLKKINNFKDDKIDGFETDEIKNLYTEYFNKDIIEYRIRECIDEEFYYLDLSNMEINDKQLNEYLKNEEIKKILKKIRLLDLSNNILKKNPIFVNEYSNIKVLNISYNEIEGIIEFNNLIELDCTNNEIDGIISNTLINITASNNKILNVYSPKVSTLIIDNNIIEELPKFKELKYLDCSTTKLKKIDYIKSLRDLICSTKLISPEFNVKKIKLINKIYYISLL